jgi:hypothetical protein
MREGLKIIQIQITNWRALTFVGWLKRRYGDEYDLIDARIITRKSGEPADWNGVADLAENGPGKKYLLAPIMKEPEELHRLSNIRRSKPADEKAWAKHCPKPKDWVAP